MWREEHLVIGDGDLARLSSGIDPAVRHLLEAALEGRELSIEAGLRLAGTQGPEFQALIVAADEMRRRQVGETVTYVVNRNINFTNVCIKHCTFCAFSRDHRQDEGYFLP
ncbi:MAG: 5-amino-6-(D-ribitylamino)uracil--L-tyrosine 4-hydroxyphenyl transferase CofH, partial [Candidatus Methylomirabilaceae bacterium]